MTVLLTGASGFLGQYVLHELAGQSLKVLVLPNDPALPQLKKRSEVVVGDVRHPSSLVDAMDGMSHVIHLAGHVNGGRGSVETFMEVNAKGTANLAKAAKAAGIEHFIYTSSITVYGHVRDAVEENRLVLTRGYPESKIKAENSLRDLLPTQTSILRLPLVLGAGDLGFMCPAIKGFRKSGKVILIGSGLAHWSVISAHDAARAIGLCLKNNKTRGMTYNVLGETITNGELLREIGKIAGCKKEIRMPYIVAWLIALLTETLGRDGLTRLQAQALNSSMSFTGDRFKRMGFETKVGWKKALYEGVTWCNNKHYQ